MAYCTPCEALEDKSADVDPHEQMRGEAHTLQRDGVLEVYVCRLCGAKWERFVGAKTLGFQSGSWKALKRP